MNVHVDPDGIVADRFLNQHNNAKGKTMKKLIVHSGPTHRDDFLTMAIVAFKMAISIFRRDPTEEELNDPEVLVVDVGNQHEPKLNNYDHHQLKRDDDPAWGFGYFLLGVFPSLYKCFSSLMWWDTSMEMDSKGPFQVAKRLGLPNDWTDSLWSPVDEAIMNMVSKKRNIEVGSDLYTMLSMIGEQLVKNAEEWYKGMESLKEEINFIWLNGVDVLIVEKGLSNSDMGVVSYIQKTQYPNAGAMVSYDNRGEGWSLYRFNDHPKVDFSKIVNEEEVLFAHPGGFIAKTKERLSMEDLNRLLFKSI